MLLKKCPFVFYLLFAANVFGQSSPYRNFTTNDGLIHNRCGNVVQDSMGYIWVTTDNGICNYDGRKFTFFPGSRNQYYFAHNNSITSYNGACIMGATDQGVARALGTSLEFIYPKNTAPKHFMCSLQINDTSYLTANVTGYKIQLVTKNKVQIISLPVEYQRPDVYCFLIFQDFYKNIWVGTNKGFVVYEKGDLNNPYIPPSFFKKYINALKQDANHNILISADSTMYYINAAGLKNIRTIIPIKFAKQNVEITAVGSFSNGDIAISNFPTGILLYNKELKLIKSLEKPLLPDVVFWDIFIDREENMWLATENGVYRYGNLNIKNYVLEMPKGTPQIKTGVGFNNSFLFSNNLDIYSLANEKMNSVKTKDYLFYTMEINTINNKLWINDYDPFTNKYKKYTKQFEYINNTLLSQKIILSPQANEQLPNLQSIITLPNEVVCMLTKTGNLVSYFNDKFLPVTMPTALNDINFSVLAAGNLPNQAVLFSKENGLYHINFSTVNKQIAVQLIQHLPFNDISNTFCINAVMDANASIWLATSSNGLYYFTLKNQAYQLEKHFVEPEISSALLTSILKDSKGNIWIGGNKGIDKILYSNGFNYTIYNGMYKNSTLGNYVYFLKEHQGLLHIGSSGGLTTVPVNATIQSITPKTYINKISCNGKEILIENILQKKVFEYTENNFSFEFTSPTFINEIQTEYQYKMDGIDANWSVPSNNYTVSYNQLPPNNYIFRVRSKNANGLWSTTDAEFGFTIKKPFYKHWLFYLFCTVAIAGLIYWLYRQKMKKLIAVERTRRSISKDLHDDIGTTLSSITLMNAVLKNKITTNPAEAEKMAEKIETTSREMIQNMSDIVWSINPNNDTIEKIINRLQQFCNDVFEEKDIKYSLTVDESIKGKSLSMQLRKDIYLICKEIITNAAKYSYAQHFNLTIFVKQNNLEITGNDDGKGFEIDQIKKGNGLNNIVHRANTHSGTAVVRNINGTNWQITIPL
jgi:signal transduction histidine kinase/ligand-binding sensor domain-containing protein